VTVSPAVELLADTFAPRTVLGESPRWAAGRWWWLDADDGRAWSSADLGSSSELIAGTGRRMSLVQPVAADLAVVADGSVLRPLRRTATGWRLGGPLDLGLGEGWVLNDGCADARGRIWIGAVSRENGPEGLLLRIDGRHAEVAGAGITVSNGMGWSPDGRTLFHVDTGRAQLLAHRVDSRSGEILASEVVWQCDDGLPDGVAVDVSGGVWVAVYGAGELRRIVQGRCDRVVEVPTAQVTSVALGGPDGCDMLITTAREGFTGEDSLRDPLAGRLFRARAPQPGVEAPLVGRNAWTY
jgi:sugar lactone lactonase YvrE